MTIQRSPDYTPPALPSDEAKRLEALHRLGILDTPPEPRFDRFTQMMQAIFDVPIALVSLVDADRQWFKSRVGIDACSTDRSASFCGHAVAANDELVVEDTHLDERFALNPLVIGPPFIRFYAGAIIRSIEGQPLGTACIVDVKPRTFGPSEVVPLREVAHFVEAELCLPI